MIPAGNTVPAGNDAIALSDPVPALRTDLAAALTVLVENSADARPFKLEDKIIARTRELTLADDTPDGICFANRLLPADRGRRVQHLFR